MAMKHAVLHNKTNVGHNEKERYVTKRFNDVIKLVVDCV